MGQNDGNTKTTLTQVIQKALEKQSKELQVALPAKVIEYKIDSGKVCADLQILVQYEDGDEYIDFPQVKNVPVQIYSGNAGQAFFSMPIQAGDVGIVLACDYGIDGWKNSNGSQNVEPSSLIRHSFSHAVFIPGINTNLMSYSGINDSEVLLKNTDGEITISANDDINITGPGTGKTINIGNTTGQNPAIFQMLDLLMVSITGAIDSQLMALGQAGGTAALWNGSSSLVKCNKIKIPNSLEP